MYEMTRLPSKLKSYLKSEIVGFISSLLDEMTQFLSKIPFFGGNLLPKAKS